MSISRKTAVVLTAAILLAAAAGIWLWRLRQPDSNAVMRGWETAQRNGCFSCHGLEGRDGAANPGSDELKVPSWDGGMLLMYVENAQEIREWILHGSPRRLLPEGNDGHNHGDSATAHKGLLSMPAYEDVLDSTEVDDLVALVRKVGKYGTAEPPEEARQGREVARRLGCFGCHRLEGLVGIPNPGSFKGYIPPWRGPDYEELVLNEEELRKWISEGQIARFQSDPLARFFTSRQKIQMPAYREHVSEADLASLVRYVQWLSRADLFE